MVKVSKVKAEKILAAVKATYSDYLTDTDPAYGPTLVDRYRSWEIVWEEGPSDWAYQFTSGGDPTEEDTITAAELSAEFGVPVAVKPRKIPKMPQGVYVEPVWSFSIGVYSA